MTLSAPGTYRSWAEQGSRRSTKKEISNEGRRTLALEGNCGGTELVWDGTLLSWATK